MGTAARGAMILRTVDVATDVHVNRQFTDVFGLATEELTQLPLLDWLHPDDAEAMKRVLDERHGSINARHRTGAGEWLSLEWRIRAHDGRLTALGASKRQSRPRSKPLDMGVPLEHASLGETLEAMVHIVESKTDGLRCSILLVDPEHEFVVVGAGPSFPAEYNAAIEGLRIGPQVGSCGTAAFWNVPVIVEDIETDPLWKDLRDAAAIADVRCCWSVPVTATNSGEVLGAMALYDRKPNAPSRGELDMLEIAARMVGLAIERDRLEEQLRLATKTEAIGVLAGGIAHDFNNLLATIMGNAELAMTRLPEDAGPRSNLQQILTATLSAADLCKQMLAYAGGGSATTELLDLNRLVREVGDLLQVTVSKKVKLDFDLGDAPLGVVGDRSQLRQVIMNLMTNAAEALEGATGHVVIGTSLTTIDHDASPGARALPPGQYVRLWVSDTGVGMSAATRARIFDPFFTTKPSGRGLGLAAVQGIVRSHGGTLVVESSPSEGTTFSMTIPHEPYVPRASSPVPPRTTASRVRILVADDEEAVRKAHAAILESANYEVVEACDGEDAVDVFRREADDIDCVLLDLNMPKLDGEEVFARLRAIRSDVRVVLTSGYAEREIMKRFEGAGLAGIVEKPTPLEVLLAKIAAALQ